MGHSTIRVSIEELKTILERSRPYLLRPINDEIVSRYVESMEAGEKFPDMLFGAVPETDGSHTYIVDGYKRSAAYLRTKSVNDVLTVPFKTYTDKGDYLADQLAANLEHGEPVATPFRDSRIKMLCAKIDEGGCGWKQERAATRFHLTQQAISKILKRPEDAPESEVTRGGKGKTRPKSKVARMQAAVEKARELGGMPFLTHLASLRASLKTAENRVKLLKTMLPTKKDQAEVRAAKGKSRILLTQTVTTLQAFAAQIEHAGKKPKGGEDA